MSAWSKKWRHLGQRDMARWKKLSAQLRREAGHCQEPGCVSRERLEVHHLKPLAEGGAMWDRRNLKVLCHKHHLRVYMNREHKALHTLLDSMQGR